MSTLLHRCYSVCSSWQLFDAQKANCIMQSLSLLRSAIMKRAMAKGKGEIASCAVCRVFDTFLTSWNVNAMAVIVGCKLNPN